MQINFGEDWSNLFFLIWFGIIIDLLLQFEYKKRDHALAAGLIWSEVSHESEVKHLYRNQEHPQLIIKHGSSFLYSDYQELARSKVEISCVERVLVRN